MRALSSGLGTEEEKLLRVEGPTRRLVEKHDRLLHFVRRLECSCSLDRCAPQCERCQVLADVTTWKPGEPVVCLPDGLPFCKECASNE